jgi:hypothetical protein
MSKVQDSLGRLRRAASGVAALESPYPLEVPKFGAGCSDTEIFELLGDNDVPEYAEFLATCGTIDAMDVFNGYSLWPPSLVSLPSPAGTAPTRGC